MVRKANSAAIHFLFDNLNINKCIIFNHKVIE
jgi:hypothetical protein